MTTDSRAARSLYYAEAVQHPLREFTTRPASHRMLRAAGLAAWVMAAVWVALNVAVAIGAPHEDFFDAQVQLGAARDLLNGDDPYTRYVQNPLWTLLFLAPFALLPDGLLYQGQFAGALVMWHAACVIALRVAGAPWGPLKLAVAGGMLCSYLPVMWSTHGQITSYNGLGTALCLLLVNRSPVAAGAALLLTAAKPHLGMVPAGGLMLWAATTGRWRMVGGLAAAAAAMLGMTVAARPSWIVQWVDAVANPPAEVVAARAKYAPTVGHLAGRWAPPELAAVLSAVLALLTGTALVRWVTAPRRGLSPLAVVAVTVPATFLLTPYSQGYDLSLLAIPGALLVGAWLRVQGSCRIWFGVALAGVYAFPYVMQLLKWPQATLLPSAVVCLALAVAYREALTPPESDPA